MPSVKEQCVCQICICGKHHCGEEIKFPSVIEEPQRELTEEEDSRHRLVGVTQTRNDLSHKSQNEKEKLTDSELIEGDTQSGHLESSNAGDQSRQHIVTITLTRSQRLKANKKETADLPEHWTEMKGASVQDGEPSGSRTEADNAPGSNGAETEAVTIKTSQRKTWQTSPEQVEELTRSLSRMRTDHEHGGYLYEKMMEKEKSKTLNRRAKDKPPNLEKASGKAAHASQQTYDQPHLVNCNGQQHYSTAKMGKGERKESQKESFLPPLTGFSDSDSSFGSFSCSVEGDHHLPVDRQMQCICESMKKTKLEDHESMPFGSDPNIKFIDVDDNWIVTRPARVKPRDNLRLEGPMEMETTFRSTYETAAQRMIERGDSEESLKSKRSTATTSRTNKGSPQLYLNTRRGRAGVTPLLRSAKKRRNARHRPMTSLKAGGDGYYNTINRDAYKNFIIVNGEAKMVGDQVKLPKVSKTTLTTTEEKNRQKYMKSKSAKKCADSKRCKNGDDKMVMIGGEEIRKFEKKSYITKSDGAEVTDVERKIVRKVKCAPKDGTTDHLGKDAAECQDKALEGDQAVDQQQKQPASYTVDNITGAPKRPFHARYQDNIKELGLLDRSEEAVGSTNTDNYRHHMRRLHETSKDFNLKLPESPLPGEKAPTRGKARPVVVNKPPPQPEQPPKSKVVNGHAMSKTSQKPFILPQRIQRHKNECSVNVFEGEMDFTTTNRSVYGEVTGTRKLRKRTAGRRSLKSSKRRNLFRQSSDSMFSSPDVVAQDHREIVLQSQLNPETAAATEQAPKFTSTYKKQFDDRLYCPALDVGNTGEKFKYTGEAGGHKYYLSSNYS